MRSLTRGRAFVMSFTLQEPKEIQYLLLACREPLRDIVYRLFATATIIY